MGFKRKFDANTQQHDIGTIEIRYDTIQHNGDTAHIAEDTAGRIVTCVS